MTDSLSPLLGMTPRHAPLGQQGGLARPKDTPGADMTKGSEEPFGILSDRIPDQGRSDLSAREMPQTPERTTSMISLVWAAVLMKASSFSLVPTSCTV